MIKVTVSGTVEREPGKIVNYINGVDDLGLRTYKERFVDGYIFIYEVFCELGYGQNADGNGRTGYLALYDFLQDFDNKKDTKYKRKVEQLIKKCGDKKVRQYGKVIKTSFGEYPSQEWHYLISYIGWKDTFEKKYGNNFKCAELLLYLYEIIDDKRSIEKILNSFISEKDKREEFIEYYNKAHIRSYLLRLDENIKIIIEN